VYDFRHPAPGNDGFHWSEIDSKWKDWTPRQFRKALDHQMAADGFNHDRCALEESDATVLVLPCGRSAHLELGYACGSDQATYVLMTEPQEPELMYKLCDGVVTSVDELASRLREHDHCPDIGQGCGGCPRKEEGIYPECPGRTGVQ